MVIARHLRSFDGQNIRNSIVNTRLLRRKMNALNIGKFCREEYAKARGQNLQQSEARKASTVTLKRPNSRLEDANKNGL
jgi:hypothetical protein